MSSCNQLFNSSTCAFKINYFYFQSQIFEIFSLSFLVVYEPIKYLLFHHTLFPADSQWM